MLSHFPPRKIETSGIVVQALPPNYSEIVVAARALTGNHCETVVAPRGLTHNHSETVLEATRR